MGAGGAVCKGDACGDGMVSSTVSASGGLIRCDVVLHLLHAKSSA